jgi:hypothetical protein
LALDEQIATWNDAQMVRQMFANYRSDSGLRLTQLGDQLMRTCFQNFEFKNCEESMQPSHLMFLDRHAKMPYFCDPTKIVIYDPLFATRLRLVGGRIATLMEIDTTD